MDNRFEKLQELFQDELFAQKMLTSSAEEAAALIFHAVRKQRFQIFPCKSILKGIGFTQRQAAKRMKNGRTQNQKPERDQIFISDSTGKNVSLPEKRKDNYRTKC